ncbi:hypothetical protein ACHWQZ_G002029 [Mnemiopsis leidyi]
MAGLLATYGYKITDDAMSADLWLLNSCTVKTPSEDGLRNSITSAHSLAINTGCLNQCTYCKTKHARGELGSYPIADIVERGVQSFAEGVREVWMTSEDTGAYGRDIGVTLPDLLYEFVKIIPEGCMLRLGMTNPPYILDYLEDMAVILSHPRVYSFLHVPVQAASDTVLEDMKREYTCAEFSRVVDFLRAKVPGITIATDIICGFPTETEDDFEETLDLIKKYQFPSLFINQFFPRPGTPAARMKKIPADKVKLRTKKASEIFQKQFPYTHKLGELQTILVTEVATDNKHYVGHNKFYDQVLVPKIEGYMGQSLTVKIVETGKHFLKGKVIEEGEIQNIPSSYSNPNKLAFSLNPYNMVQNVKSKSSVWNFLIVLVVGVMFQMLYILYRNHR